MLSPYSFEKIHQIERRILCALCRGWAGAKASFLADLNTYRWTDPEHRIVFEALSKLPLCDGKSLREMLPTQATRMGFPEVDWQPYFARAESDVDVSALIRALVKTEVRK